MTPQESRRASLRRVKVFSGLTDKDCDEVLTCLRGRALAAGQTLYEQGAQGDRMAIVMEGNLSVQLGGKEISTVGPGGLLGEMACVDPAPRSASVVATVKTTVLELSRDALTELRTLAPAANSALVGQVIREVTQRMREVNERLEKDLAPGVKVEKKQAPVAVPVAEKLAAAMPQQPQRSNVINAMRPEAAREKSAWQSLVDRIKGNS